MGADTRGKRELGDGVLDDAELVADVPADAAEVGELAYLPGGPDPARCVALGDLLAGRRPLPGGRRIVFDSVGTAVADAATESTPCSSDSRVTVASGRPARCP